MAEKESDSIFAADSSFFVMDAGKELSREKTLNVKGWSVFLCTSGCCLINIDAAEYPIKRGSEIMLFPDTVVRISDCSDDLAMSIFSCSDEMMGQALRKVASEFYIYIRRHPVYQHHSGTEEGTLAHFAIFRMAYNDRLNKYRTIIVTNVLRSLMLNIYDKIKRYSQNGNRTPSISRKEDLYNRFRALLSSYASEHRDVAFYADKMCITKRYLAAITASVANETPKQAIADYRLREVKILLTFYELSIQEISDRMHFPDVSHFCRFFKKMTGMSPLSFRKNEMAM